MNIPVMFIIGTIIGIATGMGVEIKSKETKKFLLFAGILNFTGAIMIIAFNTWLYTQ